mgnify:CR=1 FL=1
MKNRLVDLNNYLFETIERLNDDGLSDDQLRREIERSKAVTSAATAIIQNGELALKTMRHLDEYRTDGKLSPIPQMLLDAPDGDES